MLFKSSIFAKASGSLNGMVFSHNRFGMYTRNRSTPVNPSSQRQQDVRSAFTSLVADWSEVLTQAQRDAWNLFANSILSINKVGDPVNLTGQNHFVRSNTVLLQAGLPQVNDGPTTLSLPSVDPSMVVTASEAAQELSIAFDEDLEWLDEDNAGLAILMASPKGVGSSYLGGAMRYSGVILGDAVTPLTSPQVLAVPFVVTENQKTQVQARIIRADGRVSAPFWDTLQVSA